MKPVPQVAPKKLYQRPVLRVHGNIEALTAAISNTGTNPDVGGSGTMIKTS